MIRQQPPNHTNVNTDTSRWTLSADDVPQLEVSSTSSPISEARFQLSLYCPG
jgi:hypothetical protein